MKLSEITASTVKSISTRELVSLHFRTHQLYGVAENRKPTAGYIGMLEEKHEILARELTRRGYRHTTPLTKEEKIKSFLKI